MDIRRRPGILENKNKGMVKQQVNVWKIIFLEKNMKHSLK